MTPSSKAKWLAPLGACISVWFACSFGSGPLDGCPGHDQDCDGLSNAVEAESLNAARYDLDTAVSDDHVNLALGCAGSSNPFCTGQLFRGLNLPDVDRGNGYYHYYQSGDALNSNDWGTGSLIYAIERASREWRRTLSDCYYFRRNLHRWATRFGAGDLSKGDPVIGSDYMGGPWTPRHDSHQNGRDVDLRYLRTDTSNVPLDLAGPDSTLYDSLATRDLMYCFLDDSEVERLFIDTLYAKVTRAGFVGKVVHDVNHRNHFHVRIRDPDGTSN